MVSPILTLIMTILMAKMISLHLRLRLSESVVLDKSVPFPEAHLMHDMHAKKN